MKKQRFFALFFAILFLVTSSSLAIAFIWSNIQSKNNSGNSSTSVKSSSNKLAGTMLTNFTPTNNVPSLQVIDIKAGSGPAVKAGDSVTVDYTGAVAASGIIFQSSLDTGQPVTLSLNSVIAGWAQGIPGMKAGGQRRLLIPADLAYGANPPSGIPVNAPLVFDVTLHSFTPS